MSTVPGASQFLTSATLANRQGLAVQSPTLLGETSTVSLLDAGRGIASGGGLGLSSGARAINNQFLNNATDINALMSLALGPNATVTGMQGQILALRASLPSSAIDSSVFYDADDGSVSEPTTGIEVNEEV